MARSPLNHDLVVTQRFGVNDWNYPYTKGHPGLDLRSPNNDPWFAPVTGFVHVVNKTWPLYTWLFGQSGYGGLGAAMCIDQGEADGTFKRFILAHGKDRDLWQDNRHVSEGTPLCASGNTGRSTTYHLHLEIRHYYFGAPYYDGTLKLRYNLFDPENFLRDNKIPYTYK